MKRVILTVPEDTPRGIRIDKYLSENAGILTRSQIKNLLMEVRRDGKPVKPSRSAAPGSRLEVLYRDPEPPAFPPEKMELSLIHEDGNVVVVDKPQGLVVHPGSGVRSGTLVQGLLHHVKELEGNFPGEPLRPGIVHRLDRDTSGVVIAAKNPETLEFLSRQFREKSVGKVYIAVVKGRPPAVRGVVTGFLKRDPGNRKRFIQVESGGKAAETAYRRLRSLGPYTLMRLEPLTGRTHQLRVQMRSLGCPILGDPVYGRRDPRFPGIGLMLHAFRLSIRLPGDAEPRVFSAPLPRRFRDFAAAAASQEEICR